MVDEKNEAVSSIFILHCSCRLCIGGTRLLWLDVQLQKLARICRPVHKL